MSTAKSFKVCTRTVSRVWEDVLSVMEAHLVEEEDLEGLHNFYERTLTFIDFPDKVFASKSGNAGRKPKYDRKVLTERALNVPLNDCGTYHNLASQLDVSKNTIHRLTKEKNNMFVVHSSAVKPYLSEENKYHRFQYATNQVDVRSFPTDNHKPENIPQFLDFMDRVDVDEKWFNETMEARRYLLLKGEKVPHCTVRHKKHIPKIMFLSAQARPCYPNPKACVEWEAGNDSHWTLGPSQESIEVLQEGRS
jgi:hypothetical protein